MASPAVRSHSSGSSSPSGEAETEPPPVSTPPVPTQPAGKACHGGLFLGRSCMVEPGSWRRICQQCRAEKSVELPPGRVRIRVQPFGNFSSSRSYYVKWANGQSVIAHSVRPFILSSGVTLLLFSSAEEASACEELVPPGVIAPAAPEHLRFRICNEFKSYCPDCNFPKHRGATSCTIHASVRTAGKAAAALPLEASLMSHMPPPTHSAGLCLPSAPSAGGADHAQKRARLPEAIDPSKASPRAGPGGTPLHLMCSASMGAEDGISSQDILALIEQEDAPGWPSGCVPTSMPGQDFGAEGPPHWAANGPGLPPASALQPAVAGFLPGTGPAAANPLAHGCTIAPFPAQPASTLPTSTLPTSGPSASPVTTTSGSGSISPLISPLEGHSMDGSFHQAYTGSPVEGSPSPPVGTPYSTPTAMAAHASIRLPDVAVCGTLLAQGQVRSSA